MQQIQEIIDLLDRAIKEDTTNSITEGEVIADFYDAKVDEYRNTIKNAQDWLAKYQDKLIKETGIPSLKIKYNEVSGYFIDITNANLQKVPTYFIQKQTLVNSARYITPELTQFENKFLEAQGEKANREYELFCEIRGKIMEKQEIINNVAFKSTNIDFLASLSQVAYENNYTRPQISNNYDLKIISGKHPIIMKSVPDFISNNLELDNKKFVHIITGPNMGGKSTFLKQNALIILMSHIGSFIPAKEAIIPITDRIFSRIGANDNLFLGQSTFMVEMQEIANILNNATKNSFVIIDEVGRGTSTYDGMSLAWAILKDIHDKIKVKTLFATHFHELIDESKSLSSISNFSVAVGENEENLVFLRKIVPGGIKKSFGIEVAKIAGLPENVLQEAKNMLRRLEEEHNEVFGNQLMIPVYTSEKIEKKENEVEKFLREIDINNLTPIEALNELLKLKGKVN